MVPAVSLIALGVQSALASTVPAPVPRAIVSASSAWGSAADTWAGYTGALNIWVPAAVKGGWTLTFRSAELAAQAPAAAFWNAVTTYDPATQTFSVKAPSWSGEVQANAVLSIGFNGGGVLDTGFALDDCTFNAAPGVATVMGALDAQQTLAGLQAGGAAVVVPPPAGGSTTGGTPTATGSTIDPLVELLFSVNNAWEGGYGGNLTIKNLSGQTLAAGGGWQVKIKVPDLATAKDVFQSGPWNLQVTFADDGTVTLSPLPWTASVAPGNSVTSGFNGGSLTSLRTAASVDGAVSVVYAISAGTGSTAAGGSGSSTANGGTTTPPLPPVVDNLSGLPTGSLVGGFLFSPYKDVGISMNWNTNVMSTAATGALKPLLTALPAKVPAVTWAFATGECGQENWAGIAPDALAAANVKTFADANKDYVISTGGAAGAFHCSSPEGMRTFINRYASKNLVGVDFDIEAGQSTAEIANLVKQVAAVEADYPNLRFSFTIATLGSSNGAAAAAPYGDLNSNGYNVIQALATYPLTNYTINLMVMDYGSPGPGVCVVANGRCDMGQTAIQAAKNLNARFGVPYGRIELTPMIGVNDVSDELFSLADTDTLVNWALTNQLAGVHFWSVDRDTPCSQASASPTCSSVAAVPVWGWTNRFLTDLGR